MEQIIFEVSKGEAIEEVLELVEKDLQAVKEIENEFFFVAYRIRAYMFKTTMKWIRIKNKMEKGDRGEDFNKLGGYIEQLFKYSSYYEEAEAGFQELTAEELELLENGFQEEESFFFMNDYFEEEQEESENELDSIKFSELKRGNFETLRENVSLLQEFFPLEWHKVVKLAEEFADQNKESEEFKEVYNKVKAQQLPLFIEALEYAIRRVDSSREPKEIVKYINKAMMTKFFELLRKETGVKRIYNTAEKKSYYVIPSYEVDPWLVATGKTFANRGLEEFKLTPKQKEFLYDLYSVTRKELEEKNEGAFHFNKNGLPEIQKRYFAEKLEMTESQFKKKLQRTLDKIELSWNK